MRYVLPAILVLALLSLVRPATANDRHEGYYYPKVGSSEVYDARVKTLRGSDRSRRLGFVTGIAAGQQEKPYPPVTAFFAKGNDAEKAILISLAEGRMDTLYRARAYLAMLTAAARTTSVFQDLDPGSEYTFLDLLKLLGFTQLTVSDGKTYSHQFEIK